LENEMQVVEEKAVIEIPSQNIVPTVVNPYHAMIEKALMNDVDMERLKTIIDLGKDHDSDLARKAYYLAMAKFKANPPEIEKDNKVGFKSKKTGGTTSYSHATLGNVSNKINKGLGLYGLSASWRVVQSDNGSIKVTCFITHEQGFSESTSLHSPPETSGTKNSIQAIGSTITYLERYTLLALTGLATKDQDNDTSDIKSPKVNNLVKITAEYKALQETKKLFPVEYKATIEAGGGEPLTAGQCKLANDSIKALVDGNNKN